MNHPCGARSRRFSAGYLESRVGGRRAGRPTSSGSRTSIRQPRRLRARNPSCVQTAQRKPPILGSWLHPSPRGIAPARASIGSGSRSSTVREPIRSRRRTRHPSSLRARVHFLGDASCLWRCLLEDDEAAVVGDNDLELVDLVIRENHEAVRV